MTGKKSPFYLQVKQLGVLTTVPIILLVGPAIGVFLGGWIDRKAHVYPWFTIIFGALGFVASAREVMRLLRQISGDSGPDRPDD
ncbi:MAG: AtpZ/AtpI family protein [Candidatus Omnitrophica bacterium]|nr:AtpZ/AtpI family protein [Candidatus Omnitrophota bacterium]